MTKNTKIEVVDINKISINTGQIEGLPQNPRFIKDTKFNKLLESIKAFPEMLSIRPIVVDEDMIILGGNMRYRACKIAGIKEIPIIVAKNLSTEQKKQFLIKDNVAFGEWEWDLLANSWNTVELTDWGMDVWLGAQEEDLFDVDDAEEDAVAKKPKMSDDDYSVFELIMKHENKVSFLELLSKIKKEYAFEKQEEALMEMIRVYEKK